MQVTCYREKNLSYIIIDNYFTDEEYEEVLAEVKDVKRLSATPEIIDSAKNENGEFKKTGNWSFFRQPCTQTIETLLPHFVRDKKYLTMNYALR
jgi:hypothetical protein